MAAGPGAGGERNLTWPEGALGGDEKKQRIAADDNRFAKRGGFGKRRRGNKEVDWQSGRFSVEVFDSAVGVAGIVREDSQSLRANLSEKTKKGLSHRVT